MNHELFGYFRPRVGGPGPVVALRTSTIAYDIEHRALDIVFGGKNPGVCGPFLWVEEQLVSPRDAMAENPALESFVTDPQIAAFVKGPDNLIWFESQDRLEPALAHGNLGVIPGLVSYGVEFAIATAYRSIRPFIEGMHVFEYNAPAFPWAMHHSGAAAASATFSNGALQMARNFFDEPATRAVEDCDALIATGDICGLTFPKGRRLFWIGTESEREGAHEQLARVYTDI